MRSSSTPRRARFINTADGTTSEDTNRMIAKRRSNANAEDDADTSSRQTATPHQQCSTPNPPQSNWGLAQHQFQPLLRQREQSMQRRTTAGTQPPANGALNEPFTQAKTVASHLGHNQRVLDDKTRRISQRDTGSLGVPERQHVAIYGGYHPQPHAIPAYVSQPGSGYVPFGLQDAPIQDHRNFWNPYGAPPNPDRVFRFHGAHEHSVMDSQRPTGEKRRYIIPKSLPRGRLAPILLPPTPQGAEAEKSPVHAQRLTHVSDDSMVKDEATQANVQKQIKTGDKVSGAHMKQHPEDATEANTPTPVTPKKQVRPGFFDVDDGSDDEANARRSADENMDGEASDKEVEDVLSPVRGDGRKGTSNRHRRSQRLEDDESDNDNQASDDTQEGHVPPQVQDFVTGLALKVADKVIKGVVHVMTNDIKSGLLDPSRLDTTATPALATPAPFGIKQRKKAPKRRTRLFNDTQEFIRDLMDEILNCKKQRVTGGRYVRNPLPDPPRNPNKEYPDLYAATMAWDQQSTHRFNLEFCKFIARTAVLQEDRPTAVLDENLDALAEMAFRHSITLRRIWKTQTNPPDELDIIESEAVASANTRKRTLLGIRTGVAERYKLKTLTEVLHAFDTAGMSSDDEDPEKPGTFRIASKPWRDAGITQVFRALDLTHVTDARKDRRGGQKFRTRADTPVLISTRPPVPYLWENAYSTRWKHENPEEYEEQEARQEKLPSAHELLGPRLIKQLGTSVAKVPNMAMDEE